MPIEENKALVRRFIEEFWNQKNLTIADELMATNYTDHSLSNLPEGTSMREGFKQFALIHFTAFPDLHFIVEDLIAEEDRVASRWTSHGTHKGNFLSIPPTGNPIIVTGTAIDRIANGKIVESWSNFDMMGLLQQIGVIPPSE